MRVPVSVFLKVHWLLTPFIPSGTRDRIMIFLYRLVRYVECRLFVKRKFRVMAEDGTIHLVELPKVPF